MCSVSMVGDHYHNKWLPMVPNPLLDPPDWSIEPPVSRAEFDALKREVEEMRELLKRAKKYDEDNGEPDCEMADKVALLRKVADAVGVDLSEIFGPPPQQATP